MFPVNLTGFFSATHQPRLLSDAEQSMTGRIEITPVSHRLHGRIRPPGSKSITNRALILAALASGKSTLHGVLDSQDTRVMIESLRRLGLTVDQDLECRTCVVTGGGGSLPAPTAELWLENSGTSIRFLTALCAVGNGRYRLDGIQRMRQRPLGDLVRALQQLGGDLQLEEPATDCPPVVVNGRGLDGGTARINGNISSQFLSAILMAAPACHQPVRIEVTGELVSQPYIRMTLSMLRDFGALVEYPADLSRFLVTPAVLPGRNYAIEPDASAASYFFGLAAVNGGTVTVDGLKQDALQGDIEFVSALEQMGCRVEWNSDSVSVSGAPLRGIDIDMNAISDTAQTLATVAVFAEGPTRIRGVAHMRHKETDRIHAVVTELRRAGIEAEEHDDGMTIHPGTPQPCEIQTYDDHRMAMSFALLGVRVPGITILDPKCTEKTYPDFFTDLGQICQELAP